MSQPSVIITELDGQLGVLPPSAGAVFALVGPCSAGTMNTPTTFSKIKGGITATFDRGPTVEAAAHYVEKYGRPVAIVRTNVTTAGVCGDVIGNFADGYQVATIGSGTPADDFDVVITFLSPGTVGSVPTPPDVGITFQWSLDGGRTKSPVTRLGAASSFYLTGSGYGGGGDILVVLTAGATISAGDSTMFPTYASRWATGDLADALTALSTSAISWEQVQIVGPMDANAVAVADSAMLSMASKGKFRNWIGSTRMPGRPDNSQAAIPGETEASYLTNMSAEFGDTVSIYGTLYSGSAEIVSSVSGRKYERPAAFAPAALQAFVSQEVDIADINLGALPGVSVRDVNGNPKHHDESTSPGLDDARFATLRTWEGFPGVYVNRPRIFSADGSDFQLTPHRRVMNLAHGVLRVYFIRRLNKTIRVSKKTGFILEEEALEIETGALAVMRGALLQKPKASDVMFTLSRTDLILSTKTLTGQARVIPLAYDEYVELDLGFFNPGLRVVAV